MKLLAQGNSQSQWVKEPVLSHCFLPAEAPFLFILKSSLSLAFPVWLMPPRAFSPFKSFLWAPNLKFNHNSQHCWVLTLCEILHPPCAISRWGNRGPEKINHLHKIPRLVSGRFGSTIFYQLPPLNISMNYKKNVLFAIPQSAVALGAKIQIIL